ncbi:hypothetical protein [Mangrovihabitans endophyticus]|uniref:Uncharacterized protein n=1 Tax=Mangrovihabitans endophyticus TaxID=1751298 RepID=A0A8J3C5M2_9ACTN|nr:hypothetical protein [Mangrovihabitans endophyticus]GGL12676.1 hypothetical protein GCM10012284_54220 [Mangrovihabitans endophyticus]
MTLLPMGAPIRRALTLEELTAVLARIRAAEDISRVLAVAVVAVYDTLLADRGLSMATLPDGQQLDPRKFLIPASQRDAVTGAVLDRAAAEGGDPGVALDLVNLLPGSYDDPDAPVPDGLPGPARRSEHLEVVLTRDAVEAVTAAGHHIQALAAYYGQNSREHVTAATTWLACLTQVLSTSGGPQLRVAREGTLSLLVRTVSGFTVGVIFHGDARRCIAGDGCTALIDDDGTVHAPYAASPVAEHRHQPGFPLQGPRPGSWSLHS